MTQTLKLRPMSETPERWPVLVFGPLSDDAFYLWPVNYGEIFYDMSLVGGQIGYVYADQLNFEVEE